MPTVNLSGFKQVNQRKQAVVCIAPGYGLVCSGMGSRCPGRAPGSWHRCRKGEII